MGRKPGWGKLNSGQPYGVIALDMARAFAWIGLNRYEGIVMELVKERSWTAATRRKKRDEPWPDPIPCRLDDLPNITGLPRNRLSEAKGNLVRMKLLIESHDEFTINKKITQWEGMDKLGISFCAAQNSKPNPESRNALHVNDSGKPDKHDPGFVRNSGTAPIDEARARQRDLDLNSDLDGALRAPRAAPKKSRHQQTVDTAAQLYPEEAGNGDGA